MGNVGVEVAQADPQQPVGETSAERLDGLHPHPPHASEEGPEHR
jgi:hypothetical protein